MHWYHDHRLDNTGRNVWRGLAGIWISDDDFDLSLPLPRGRRDIPLMLSDRSFDRHNQLTDPFKGGGGHAPNDGVVGRHVLVNGAILPHHRVKACRYRLRILNASNFRSYDLAIGGGAKITQIGTEAGLMPKPLARRRILLGPAERVDLIVDFAARQAQRRRPRERPPRRRPRQARLEDLRRTADAVPGRQAGPRCDLDPGDAAAAARLGRRTPRRRRRRRGGSRSGAASRRRG